MSTNTPPESRQSFKIGSLPVGSICENGLDVDLGRSPTLYVIRDKSPSYYVIVLQIHREGKQSEERIPKSVDVYLQEEEDGRVE